MTGNVGRRLFSGLLKLESSFSTTTRSRFTNLRFADNPSRNNFWSYNSRLSSSWSLKGSKHVIVRSFAPGSFLAIGASSSSTTVAESGASYAVAAEQSLRSGRVALLRRRAFPTSASSVWRRQLHSSNRGNEKLAGSKSEPTSNAPGDPMTLKSNNAGVTQKKPPTLEEMKATAGGAANKHLIDRLPHMPHLHRPTKEELLAAATGFWSRLKVRFKWSTIRSMRPFNMDEIGAFFSWVLLGHVVWIVLGTTTFFSLAILAINTVFAQETLAGWIGNYLTKSSGVKVVFESAVVPKWKDGVITFKNVFVSQRPGQGRANVTKGSPETAAAAAAAAALSEKAREADSSLVAEEDEDINYTEFDVSIATVNVTLSFSKWFNGKGLLRDVEVKGIRGVIDRTNVRTDEDIDPKSYRHKHSPGDFELDSFKMEDVLVTVYQPQGFRPFPVSIFFADLPQLRKRFLFYDILSANTMSGSFDNSLFTIHPRQTHGYTGAQLNQGPEHTSEGDPWKKHSRLRIDSLSIDHLNRNVEGPFSWIHEGNVDIVADIMFPADSDESIAKVMSDFYERMEATVTSNRHKAIKPTSEMPADDKPDGMAVTSKSSVNEDDKRFLVMDLRVHLNDVRASVPIFTRDLSYVNNALIRPIVAYINSRRTFIPINCRVVKRVSDFDGSWTVFDSGLMDDLSAEAYDAFARDVVDDQARKRRMKKVGLWSLQLAVQAIFMGMAGNIIV